MKDPIYTSKTTHQGDMRCHTVYSPSQDTFTTDVPAAIGGQGSHPSPGDMLASCVASCMLSMIAFTGAKKGFETKGISIEASCAEGARGIGSILLNISVPFPVSPSAQKMMEAAAASCPVGNAIHPDVEKKITWNWTTP